jgi:hypothetical protein
MRQFLATLPLNLVGCFKGRRIVWHVIAIVLTFILVTSGFDWRYFLATRSSTLRSWMFPAVRIGGLLPFVLPLILWALGIIVRNARATLIGWAVGQAAILGLLIAAACKAVTGRPHPPRGFSEDNDAYEAATAKLKELRKQFSAWEAVSRGADFPNEKQG